MKNIIFVNPPLNLSERYGVLGGVLGELQPYNLCSLAAATKMAGFETTIIDAPALKLSIQQTAAQIILSNPDYIGITATTCSITNAHLLATEIKKQLPQIIIIVGGVHISALPQETLKAFKNFDIGVIGEGEITIVNLLKTLKEDTSLDQVNGIIFKKNNSLYVTPAQSLIEDLDMLPFPSWNLLSDFNLYHPNLSSLHRLPIASLVTSRGCTQKCTFCDKSVFGNRVRTHSPKYIIKMIKELKNTYSIKEVIFKDHDFAFSEERILKICHQLKESGLALSWSCMLRADKVNKNILQAMKESGCWQIGLGIESGSPQILKDLIKNLNPEKIHNNINLIKNFNFNLIGYFILGTPTETRETITETRNFIRKSRLDSIKLNFFTAYPGSPIYQNLKIAKNLTETWPYLNSSRPTFIPENLTEQELWHSSKKILKEFYLRLPTLLSYGKRALNLKLLYKFFIGMLTLIRYIFKKN